jgi:hypothetical protein
MGQDLSEQVRSSGLVYKPSAKHCEPLTAQKPGTKCPRWSVKIAQRLLDLSEPMGDKRVATCEGVAFVAQMTDESKWHGYPEAWDKIDVNIVARWKKQGLVKKKDLNRWATEDDLRTMWKELQDAGE